jgi:gliding motility-associated-like protein
MKFIKALLYSFSILFLIPTSSYASHVPGGNITYECVGPNQYAITLTLYEDCGSAFEGNGSQFITINNDCGIAGLTSATLPNVIYQQEVSQLCPAQIGSSECNGGNLPGVWMHQWTQIVTLPAGCDNWTFSYSSCCRNTSNNLSAQDSYYFEATLYNNTAPCNSSAQIASQPIPYVCVNQVVNFNMAAYDPDGNTLVYSFIPAMTTGPATSVTYNGGFSATVPIPGITIDPATGQVTFTPTVTGNYVVAVLIQEYDANGNLVGTIVQDFQYEVITCTNIVPNNPVGGITNYTGSGGVTGGNSIQVCEGDSFCFNLIFSDTDASNTLIVTSNLNTIFPTAVLTLTGTNPVTANVCYTVQPGDPTLSTISFTVEDNACPITGINTFPVEVNVITSTYAGPDEIMCLGVGTQLTGSGGTNFNWTVISGSPITPANFSCTNCSNPTANPAVTTTYQVVSNLSGGCVNTDQITVTVVPDFTFTLTQSSGTSCLADPVQINITPSPAGAYTYSWSPATYLSSTTIANPTVTVTVPGTYTYTVNITSPNGCVKTDQVTIVVAPYYPPTVTASASVINVPCGQTSQLNVDLGGGIPASCGLSTSGGCSGPASTLTQGNVTGANTNYSYPTPYGNFYANEKHQFLYTAAELNAMGFIGGKITQIGWQITALGGLTTFPSYTIKIGCTNATALTTTFIPGLTTVYGPQNTTVNVGWNMHTFATAYEWDGTSNLVVEICYNWTAQFTYTTNSIVNWTTTSFISSSWINSDGTAVCPELSGFGTGLNRPVTRFSTCPSIPDPADFTFAWTPSSTLNNATIQNPIASPVSPVTTYTVTVTNINGGCSDQSTVTINTNCPTCDPPIPVGTNIVCNGGTDGSITATVQGTVTPYTVNWYDAGGNLIQTTPGVTTTDALTNLPAGVYTIESIDATGCTNDTTFTLTEPSPVTVTASNDQTICINGTATIAATGAGGTSPYTFAWDNGLVGNGPHTVAPTLNTCYNVTAVDANGCAAALGDQICITINPPLTLVVSNDTLVCPGSTVTFDATVTGGNGGPYNFVWTNSLGATVSTTATMTTSSATPDVFCVTVTDGCSTPSVNDCVTLTHAPVPVPSFIGDNLSGCYPVPVNFLNTTNPADVSSVTWTFGNGNSSTQILNANNNYITPGCYDVTLQVTSPNGCVSSTTVADYICVFDYPIADFIPTPQPTDLFNSTVVFTNTSIDANQSLWDFGGLGTSTSTNPSFFFPNDNPGNYVVSLIVTNANGCTDTTEQTIIINGIYTLYVPNAFSPNNDGLNDVLTPLGDGISATNYEFMIFNRWGELIFQTTQLGQGWDGTEGGLKSKVDVYVWKIKSRSAFDDSRHENVGSVTLIR